MLVKDFLKLLVQEDNDKELCVYILETGERIPITIKNVDFDFDNVIDINISVE